MKIKLVLTSVTALSVLMATGALADNNKALLVQQGDANSGLIKQIGVGNGAGTASGGAGSTWAMWQNGNNNGLDLLQSGDNNIAGTTSQIGHIAAPSPFKPASRLATGSSWTRNSGVDQVGSWNKLDIVQMGNSNLVGAISQTGALNATSRTNTLIIKQEGSTGYNLHGVADVQQNNTGNGSAGLENYVEISQKGGGSSNPANAISHGHSGNVVVLATQDGTADRIIVNQDGRDHIVTQVVQSGAGNSARVDQYAGDQNWVGLLSQKGSNNSAAVNQNGSNNVVVSLTQDSLSWSLGNIATVTLRGDNNGTSSLSGDASTVGLSLASISQLGSANSLSYDVLGDNNSFAFDQIGDGNSVIGKVVGSDNQVAVKQGGGQNYAFAQQLGASNNIGIIQ